MTKGRAGNEFTKPTRQLLSDRVGGVCSKPDCRIALKGPSATDGKKADLGVAAHISGAAPGSARWNPDLKPADRKSPENGIWLCWNHSKLVDDDEVRYPDALLHAWKADAEAKAANAIDKGTSIPGPDDGSSLAHFPPHIHDLAETCRQLNPDDWLRITDWLGNDPQKHQAALKVLHDEAPSWVAALGTHARHFLAILASAHRECPVEHFAAAAQLSAEGRDYFSTMSAATGGKEPPSKVNEGFASSQLYRAVAAAAEADSETLLEMSRAEGIDLDQRGYVTVASLCLNALGASDDLELTIELAQKVTASGPCSYRIRLVEVSAISERVAHGLSLQPTADLELVLSQTIAMVEEVRRWGGPSYEPAEIAVRTAKQLGDLAPALALLDDPDAPEIERTNPALQRQAVHLGLCARDADLGSPVLQALNRAFYAITDNDSDAAHKEALFAANEADDLTDLSTAQQLLAHLGSDEIPRLAELPHDHARAELQAKALVAAGKPDDAIQLLRPIKHHQGAAQLLIQAYEANEQMEAALDEARSAQKRFGGAHFVLMECRILEATDQVQRALATITEQIATSPSFGRQRLRTKQLELLAKLESDDDILTSLQAERNGGEAIPSDWRWAAVNIHARRGQIGKAALEILVQPVLMPANTSQAVSALHWLLSHASREAVHHAIEIAEAFPEDEDVLGTLLQHFTQNATHGRRHLAELAERYAALHDSFFEQFPDSTYLQVQNFDADDPEALAAALAALEAMAGPQSEAAQRAKQQAEFAWQAGGLPAGAMGELGRAYLELTVGSDMIRWRAGCSPKGHEARLAVAIEALDGAVIWDPSSLAVAVQIPDAAKHSIAAFQTNRIPTDVLARVQLERSNAPIHAWGFDENGQPSEAETRKVHASVKERRLQLVQLAQTFDTAEVSAEALLAAAASLETDESFDRWWLTSIALAIEHELPLYSCERAITLLAVELGIPTFDYLALHEALYETGRISDTEFLGLIPKLLQAGYFPIPDPLTAQNVMEHASHSPSPAAFLGWMLSDPEFWLQEGSNETLQTVLVNAPLEEDELINIAYAAGAGLAALGRRPTPPTAMLAAIGRLTPSGVFRAVQQLQRLFDGIGSSRTPLLELTRDLQHGVDGQDPAQHLQWIMALFADFNDADRHSVTRFVLEIE